MSDQTVHDVGEFGLIERLIAALPPAARAPRGDVVVAAGDDAAVIDPRADHLQVITTDALIEGRHFRLDWTSWAALGHKALAVNLSDVAAMGARPTIAVVSLGLRGDEHVSDLEDVYRGMGALAVRFGVVIIGGDIVKVTGERWMSITAMGSVERGRQLTRAGARPGDVIGITGTIGAAAAGLEILRQPDRYASMTTAGLLVDAHLRPTPRVDAGRLLSRHGATAAMDLSDGLAGDLPKILEASGVSAEIEVERLPVIAAVRSLFPDTWMELALRGGEDFELLFTIDPESWDTLATAATEQDITVTQVGRIVASNGHPQLVALHQDGRREQVPTGAFDHFAPGDDATPQ